MNLAFKNKLAALFFATSLFTSFVATAEPLNQDYVTTLEVEQIVLSQAVNVPAYSTLVYMKSGLRQADITRIMHEEGCMIVLQTYRKEDGLLRKRTMKIKEVTVVGSVVDVEGRFTGVTLHVDDSAVASVFCQVDSSGVTVGRLCQLLDSAGFTLQFVSPKEF